MKQGQIPANQVTGGEFAFVVFDAQLCGERGVLVLIIAIT